jgi:hypothetical protein
VTGPRAVALAGLLGTCAVLFVALAFADAPYWLVLVCAAALGLVWPQTIGGGPGSSAAAVD